MSVKFVMNYWYIKLAKWCSVVSPCRKDYESLVPRMEEFCDQINDVSAITLCAALYFWSNPTSIANCKN